MNSPGQRSEVKTLRRIAPAAAVLALLATTSLALRFQDAPRKPPAPKPISVLGWLVGGVWTAVPAKNPNGGGLQRIETRYAWSDNNAYIRFTTHFVSDKGTLRNYDGQFYWNPDRSSLAMWYMDAGNSITEGPVKFDGDDMQMTFRAEDFEGKMADLRVKVTRQSNDDYNWLLEEKIDDGWKQLITLEYHRTPGS